jgi:hypothetical protein
METTAACPQLTAEKTALRDRWWMLLLLLVILGAEWYLRRRKGLLEGRMLNAELLVKCRVKVSKVY